MPYPTTFDRSLPLRIKKYIEKHPDGVDIELMAEDLQKLYRADYGRRKRNAFRILCAQVHNDVASTMGVPLTKSKKKKKRKVTEDCENGSSLSDNEENCVEYKETNLMNKSLSQMYNKTDSPSKDLEPSKEPTSYNMDQAQKGWFIDRGPYHKEKENKEVEVKMEENSLQSQNTNDQANLTENNEISKIRKDEDIDDNPSALHNVSTLPPVVTKQSSDAGMKRKKQRKDGRDKKFRKTRREKDSTPEEMDFHLPTKKQFEMQNVDVTFKNFAGNDASLEELGRLLLHMSHPEIYSTLGVAPPRGVLLHGPPGCGKTLLGNAIAGQLNLPILRLSGPELVGGVSGESEKRVREIFDTAVDNAPCVLFLDEIDAVGQRRDNASKDMERRIVAQLLTCMDDVSKGSGHVMVVGATNRPDTLDPSLRRAGRFDREICLGIPDEKARIQILKVLCKDLKLADDVSYQLIARLTPGYVGADLLSLCREAAMHAVNRILKVEGSSKVKGSKILDLLQHPNPLPDQQLQELSICCHDYQLAVRDVQPSAKREGFATVPDVTWDDVGALEGVREELSIAILGPVRNPAAFAALGLSRASGVLLAGPPGCGKTLLAKAVANQSGINFVSVKGPELLNMYVGESERAVRQCFERARHSSPCVIFFDELDSLCPRRSSAEAGASARVVNQMLTELDGLESRKQVFVVAATNRPDIIDPAVLRPGRLDKTLYIGIPTNQDREKILRTITKNGTKPLFTDDVDLKELASDPRCQGFTGADLSALVRESSLNALRHSIGHSWDEVLPEEDDSAPVTRVTLQNVEDALSKLKPSISAEERAKYEKFKSKAFPS